MPYNTNAIPRPEETTGTSSLPLARVKKIVAQDEDIAQCSNGAAFAISVATEEFLRYLTEQAYNVAKSEAKPRKNIQYKDIAAAVSKLDNLQFLSDTVPRTVTYKQVKESQRKAKDADGAEGDEVMEATNGAELAEDGTATTKQRSIAHMIQNQHAHNQSNGAVNGQTDSASKSPKAQRISLAMATSPIVDRTVETQSNGHTHPEHNRNGDVEMED